MSQTRVLLDGLGFPELTRWRDGRVWVCNWGAGEVLAVTSGGVRRRLRIAAQAIPFSLTGSLTRGWSSSTAAAEAPRSGLRWEA